MRFLHTDIEIGVVGTNVDLTYDFAYLGESASALDDILGGKSEFAKVSFLFCGSLDA